MRPQRVAPSEWKDQSWKTRPESGQEGVGMARGKKTSASLHRRWQEAVDEAQEWKKQSRAQAREIQLLTADVNLIPAMKERIASLEMQLSLATCQEIESLNAIVASQHLRIEELDGSLAALMKRYQRLIDRFLPRERHQTPNEWMQQLDTAVNGEDATFEVLDVVIEDPHAPSKAQRRIGAEGVRTIARARNRNR